MTAHDNEARIASDAILYKWRSADRAWKNTFVDSDIHYVKSTQSFPAPDSSFFTSKKQSRIAIEFKPGYRESKGGMLRGLGQSIAYLSRHPSLNRNINDASFLVMPETIDNFKIGDFLENIFKININLKSFNVKLLEIKINLLFHLEIYF